MSSSHLFPYSTVPFRRVGKIQFSVWNPEELKGYSMTQKVKKNNQILPAGIFTHELYRNGEPVDGGLADPRMGSMWMKDDPGYFGHIELSRPVYHVGFIKTVLSILRCVSMYDGKLLFHEEDEPVVWEQTKLLHGRAKLRALVSLSAKYRVCRNTAKPLPKYSKVGLNIYMTFDEKVAANVELPGSGERTQTLSAAMALDILRKISDEDCIRMGFDPKFARPDWFIISVLPVPPVHVRPSVSMGSITRSEDDLTHKLSDIVKANIAVTFSEKNGDPGM